MLAAVRAWIAKYEIFLMLGTCLIMVIIGWRAHGIYYKAERTDALEKALQAQHDADKLQFDHDLAAARAQAVIDRMNENLNQDVDNEIKNHPDNCAIAPSRVSLINRAASRN